MFNQNLLTGIQVISFNPILNEGEILKNAYIRELLSFVDELNLIDNSWSEAERKFYDKFWTIPKRTFMNHEDWKKYGLYFLTDLAVMLGYNAKVLSSSNLDSSLLKIRKNLSETQNDLMSSLRCALTLNIFDEQITKQITEHKRRNLSAKQKSHWAWLKRQESYKPLEDYFSIVENNLNFIQRQPFEILVTATMSAGKSTFINSLVGQKVTLSQNLACTSKIHSIIGKAYDDGCIYKDDGVLNLNVPPQNLLKDNPENLGDKMATSIYFQGNLSGLRVVIHDSPGVNASEHTTHKNITENFINENSYDLMIYVMNATQLFTNDEEAHIEFIKKNLGDKKILFLINKIDMINPDEENILEITGRVRRYLIDKGFQRPIVCPVSSLAGIFVKCNHCQFSNRSDERRFYTLVDKFDKMSIAYYYQKNFRDIKLNSPQSEGEHLLQNSGFAYVERIIKNLSLS